MIIIIQPLQSVQTPIIKTQKLPLFTIDHIAKPLPNAAQTLEDQHFEEPKSHQPHLDCLTQAWQKEIHLFARQLKKYSNEAHLSTVMAAIQYSETLLDTNLQNKDDLSQL
jgi:hypothetical protein